MASLQPASFTLTISKLRKYCELMHTYSLYTWLCTDCTYKLASCFCYYN